MVQGSMLGVTDLFAEVNWMASMLATDGLVMLFEDEQMQRQDWIEARPIRVKVDAIRRVAVSGRRAAHGSALPSTWPDLSSICPTPAGLETNASRISSAEEIIVNSSEVHVHIPGSLIQRLCPAYMTVLKLGAYSLKYTQTSATRTIAFGKASPTKATSSQCHAEKSRSMTQINQQIQWKLRPTAKGIRSA